MNLNLICYLLPGLSGVACTFYPYPFTLWFLIINLFTLIIYGTDKLAACKSWQRVPEFTLLILGLIGGWSGAIIAQQLFRHKTQKQPFKTYFFIIVLLNIVVFTAINFFILSVSKFIH